MNSNKQPWPKTVWGKSLDLVTLLSLLPRSHSLKYSSSPLKLILLLLQTRFFFFLLLFFTCIPLLFFLPLSQLAFSFWVLLWFGSLDSLRFFFEVLPGGQEEKRIRKCFFIGIRQGRRRCELGDKNKEGNIYKRPRGIDAYVLMIFYSDKGERGKDGWGFGSKTTNKRMWESHFLWFSNTASTGP